MKAVITKFFPGDHESSFAFFNFSCVWSTCPLLATLSSCAWSEVRQSRRCECKVDFCTWSLLLCSEKPGGLGKSPRGALSLSVKSTAHGRTIRKCVALLRAPKAKPPTFVSS